MAIFEGWIALLLVHNWCQKCLPCTQSQCNVWFFCTKGRVNKYIKFNADFLKLMPNSSILNSQTPIQQYQNMGRWIEDGKYVIGFG